MKKHLAKEKKSVTKCYDIKVGLGSVIKLRLCIARV